MEVIIPDTDFLALCDEFFPLRLNFTNSAQGVKLKKLGRFVIDRSFETCLKMVWLFGVYVLRRVGEIEP